MRVSASTSDGQAEATEKPAKSRSSVKTKAAKAAKAAESAEGGSETKETGKTAKATKADSKKAPAGASVRDRDAEVLLSAKGKAASIADREVKEAETLMDHVETGKLSTNENNLAMDRVSAILKKYGKA